MKIYRISIEQIMFGNADVLETEVKASSISCALNRATKLMKLRFKSNLKGFARLIIEEI